MPNSTRLRSFSIALFAWALIAAAPAFAQHVHGGYGGGWHGGYGWRGGYYGGYHGGYYGGWRGGYYGPWGWWGGYGLPYYYSAYGWGGAPYYYADNNHVTAPPASMANQGGAASAGPSQQPVVYPKNSQSQEQQGKDTYECHRWAVGQTGFDPTQGAPGNRSEYFRAQAACLEGRGYTVN